MHEFAHMSSPELYTVCEHTKCTARAIMVIIQASAFICVQWVRMLGFLLCLLKVKATVAAGIFKLSVCDSRNNLLI